MRLKSVCLSLASAGFCLPCNLFCNSVKRGPQLGQPYLPTVPISSGTVTIWRPKPDVPPDDPKKPIRPDLSRSTPKNTILNLLFACSLCSSVGIQVSSVSFSLFSCTRPWWAVIQTKNLFIRALFWLNSPVIFLSHEGEKHCIYIRSIFSCRKCVESLTKTFKNAYLTVSIFKIFRGSMPPDPPRKARASPSQ